MRLPSHGANPHRLYAQTGIPMPEEVLDFSENINPLGMPASIHKAWPSFLDRLTTYPDPKGEPFLTALSDFHQLPAEYFLLGNGAAELFALVARLYPHKRALVVHPTFSEYERTLAVNGVEIDRVFADAANNFSFPMDEVLARMEKADVLYICTPNNPTGVLPSRQHLSQLIAYGEEVQCDLVIDEAFIDFVDESLSFIADIQSHEHVLVVRSMTKMYAIPGIRLGYLVGAPKRITQLQALAPHWNVNRLAAEIGALCLAETSFVEETKSYCQRQREEMTTFLRENGCLVTASRANFLSFQLPDATKTDQFLHDLLVRGIVLRHSENFRGMEGQWLRMGIKSEGQMSQLRKECKRWFADN